MSLEGYSLVLVHMVASVYFVHVCVPNACTSEDLMENSYRSIIKFLHLVHIGVSLISLHVNSVFKNLCA